MTERHQTEERTHDEARPLSVSARLGRLQFHQSGKFRVLQFADIQDKPKISKDTVRLIEASLDAARPDLAVFTGNQIAGYDTAYAATFRRRRWCTEPLRESDLMKTEAKVRAMYEALLTPLVERGVPFAITYGNHDFQCGLSVAELDAIAREFPGCLNAEPFDDGPAPTGDAPSVPPRPRAMPGSGLPDQPVFPCEPGTFALPVSDVDRSRTVLALVLVNSGDYVKDGGYGAPSATALDFLRALPGALAARTLVFQHMPVPQYYDLLLPAEQHAPGAIQGYRTHESTYYVMDDAKMHDGSYLGEGISCPDADSGEFALLRDGDCFGIVAGHDHRNGFAGEHDGMLLVATPTCGFGSYGPAPEKRAARLFEFDIRHPYSPRTQLLEFGELIGKPSSRKAYAYDIADVKAEREGMNLLHKKSLWKSFKGLFA